MKIRLKTIVYAAALVASTFAASHAAATVVDFENISDWTELTSSGLTSSGFQLSSGNSGFAYILAATNFNSSFSGNGTTRLVNFNGSNVTISAANKGAFDLVSFDGGESWLSDQHFWATQITAVGKLAGGGTTTQTFDLDIVRDDLKGMQRFVLDASFRNLLSVTFSGIGGNPEFSIDNISVNEVPEPASGALLLLGAAGIAAAYRRRARSAA